MTGRTTILIAVLTAICGNSVTTAAKPLKVYIPAGQPKRNTPMLSACSKGPATRKRACADPVFIASSAPADYLTARPARTP